MSNYKNPPNDQIVEKIGEMLAICGTPKEMIKYLTYSMLAVICAVTEDPTKRMVLAASAATAILDGMKQYKEMKNDEVAEQNAVN